jgi:GTP-binding protein
MALTVAIVGRPNVGKSTLFNRLVGRREALTHDEPGVTRDRRVGAARLGPLEFTVIDTAGFDRGEPGALAGRMLAQTERAVAEADLVLFVVDGRAGLTAADRALADYLRRAGGAVCLVVNKCEGGAGEAGRLEAFELGLGEPVALSAAHGEGLAELYDALAPLAEASEAARPGAAPDGAERPLRLAIIGRPNVGKSSLLNRLLGEERVITGPEPGLTRDAIAVDWRYRGRPIRLIDTAGLRRRARTTAPLDKLSAADTLRTIRAVEVVIVVFDGSEPPARQDFGVAALAAEEGRALVIALNKWDLVRARRRTLDDFRLALEQTLAQVKGVRLVPCAALTGEGVERLMPAVLASEEAWNRRIGTAALNRWLGDALERHPPPLVRGRRVKLRYMTQATARPPSFVAFVSQPLALPDSYARYLVNGLRQAFGLDGVPLRLAFRKGDNPFAPGRPERGRGKRLAGTRRARR